MTARCTECKAEIDEDAKLCRYCQSYQDAWKNHFRFAAISAGLLAIIVSAGAYIWGEVVAWRHQINWEDKLELVEFARCGVSIFINSGDGDVYLSYVHLGDNEEEIVWEEFKPINTLIRPGEFAVVRGTSLDNLEKSNYKIAAPMSEEVFMQHLTSTSLWESCVFFDVYYEEGSSFEMLRNTYGDALNTFDVEGVLNYRSSFHGTWQSLSLQLKGVLILNTREECADSLKGLRSKE